MLERRNSKPLRSRRRRTRRAQISNAQICFRLTPDERKRINAAARVAGAELSQWVREACDAALASR